MVLDMVKCVLAGARKKARETKDERRAGEASIREGDLEDILNRFSLCAHYTTEYREGPRSDQNQLRGIKVK
jgi:hypothetical protein